MTACHHYFDFCLDEEDVNHVRTCIRLDRECADVCQMVLYSGGRLDSLRNDLVALCATIC
ncbi:four-helix bundle copper-binding protein [Alkalibacterium sp. AK22]|uniref:four-helix bundle copper-binding protein n=1 Tax=Alkalibacterium sp. AK22 TaxID=1229520 RepID=UPI001E37AD05|nr:four-helix bundle copper-binding protein [Alkalibacterium sp. AK22]